MAGSWTPLWTGAQFTVVRVVTAFAGAFQMPWWTVPALGALAIGWHTRLAAALALACWLTVRAPAWNADAFAYAIVLLLFIRAPGDPYGSWDRRGRLDPGADWRFPVDAWLAACSAFVIVAAWGGPGLYLLCLFAFPPGLLRGRRAQGPDVILYDGRCGLCHGVVRFLLSEDPVGSRFRFEPLASAAESVMVRTDRGDLFDKSAAVLYLMQRLGGFYRIAAAAGGILPRHVADAAYDFVAARRRRAEPRICPALPRHLRERFDGIATLE